MAGFQTAAVVKKKNRRISAIKRRKKSEKSGDLGSKIIGQKRAVNTEQIDTCIER